MRCLKRQEERHLLEGDSTRCVRLRAVGQRFVTGIAIRYDDRFPPALEGILGREAFDQAMHRINATMRDYWPCGLVFWGGILAAPCTLGLSLLAPRACVNSCEAYARQEIRRINARPAIEEAGVSLELRRGCCTSWVEIRY